jgi:hypothetical protein
MRNRNENQNKHIANSLRIIGMAQFAHYGIQGMTDGDVTKIMLSAVAYVIIEFLAIYELKE